MSYAMGYHTILSVEASKPTKDFVFDIVWVHSGGWVGQDRIDFKELQIIKCHKFTDEQMRILKADCSERDLDRIRHIDGYIGIERLENSEFDLSLKDIDQYKEAIEKFRKLAVFT